MLAKRGATAHPFLRGLRLEASAANKSFYFFWPGSSFKRTPGSFKRLCVCMLGPRRPPHGGVQRVDGAYGLIVRRARPKKGG